MKLTKLSFGAILMLGLFLLPPAARAQAPGGEIRLKTGEMTLYPFLQMVSEKLDLQIDASGLSDGNGETITVPDAGPLSPSRAKEMVLSALYIAGYTWIHNASADIYRIVRQRDARDQEIPTLTAQDQLPDSDLLVTYLMKLAYIPPDYVARTIRSFMPANSRIIPDESTSSVLISDSAHNIAKLEKLIARLDNPETAKQAKDWLATRAKKMDTPCPTLETNAPPPSGLLIALFSLIALVIGFLSRGYVIRRIEGGL